MTTTGFGYRLRSTTFGRLAAAALAILTIASIFVLFVQIWRPLADRTEFARTERQGVEYLRALDKMTVALADAQNAAVSGKPVSRDALSRAAEAVTTVDTRVGEQAGGQQRWAGLRAKIEALPDRTLATPAAVFEAYGETTDLLLALYGEVRGHSGLEQDPDRVTYYLQDASADEMPQLIITAGRFADLSVLSAAAGTPTEDQQESPAPPAGDPAAGPQVDPALVAKVDAAAAVAAARGSVVETAGDLVDDLQAAVDDTPSGSLGPNLLAQLDRFRNSVGALTPPAIGLASGSAPAVAAVTKARVAAQSAAASLNAAILSELDSRLKDRVDEAGRAQGVAIGVLTLAELLLLGTLAVVWLGGRDAGRRAAERPPTGGPAAAGPRPGDAGQGGWPGSGRHGGGRDPSPGPDPVGVGSRPPGPGSSRLEWSGAPR